MSTEEKKATSPTSDQDDTPRNTIRVIKSGDTDDTVVEVKVAGESEAKVTVFGGESPKNEKVADDKKKDIEKAVDEKKTENEKETDPSKNEKAADETKKQSKKVADDTKKENPAKGDKDEGTKVDESKDSKDHEPLKPLTQDEIDKIIKEHAKMDDRSLKRYLEFFWSVDKERYGMFNIQQFAYRLRRKGCMLDNRRLAEIFTDIDHNNDLLISLDEYLDEMSKNKRRPRTEAEMKELFNFYDYNDDGFVSCDDVVKALESINQTIFEPFVYEFLEADRSGKGEKLDFKDFTHAVRRLIKY